MAKRSNEKKPLGRPPAGAVLVEGKWQLTEKSKEIAKSRLLRHREQNRTRRESTRDWLRRDCPELFEHPPARAEVLAQPPRSSESQSTLWQYQKKE